MTDEELTAVATLAGVIVAAVFGVGGLVFGIIGAVQASRAKTAANKANKIAKDANELSAEANRLVKKANKVIKSQAARENERSDVEWEWKWDTTHPQHVIVQNVGKALAKNVIAQFWFNDVHEANDKSPLDIEGQDWIRLEIPGLREARRTAAMLSETARLNHSEDPRPAARTRLRVTWETPLGSVGKQLGQWEVSPLLSPADDLNHLVWTTDE
jgi:hypothetical protein